MRFQLKILLKEKKLPLNYRKAFMSYIKAILMDFNDGIYFKKYYKDTIQKDFTYAIILPTPHFTKKEIELDNNHIKVIFSTDDSRKTGFIMFQCFLKMKNKRYPLENENFFQLENIALLNQRVITEKRAYFRTIPGAPLCIRNHERESNKDVYISIADKEFENQLMKHLKRQLRELGQVDTLVNELKLKVLDGKKVVIKHYGYIDCTACVLEVFGDPLLLQFIYDNGILSRRAEGFGMLELIE